MENLASKTVLITGGARRLGREIALRLASEGSRIVIHYRNSVEDAQKLVAEISALGGTAFSVQEDLKDDGSCRKLIEKSMAVAGKIDFLINNASSFFAIGVEDASLQQLQSDVGTNAFVPFLLSKYFRDICHGSAIVNMLDSRIKGYDRTHFTYYLSKKMLENITYTLSRLYAPETRVNGVAPGLILAPSGEGLDYLLRLSAGVPLQRYGKASDVAETVLFLLRSDFITGQVIFVDGGQHMLQHVYGGKR
ncbi:MAG: SDR family oxidoreductase [Methanomassiliicoccales archaeon]